MHQPSVNQSGDAAQDFRACIEFMHRNLASNISLARLAMIASMSLPTFNRRFKSTFGCTAQQFLRKLRLKGACKLLRQGTHHQAPLAR